MVQNPLFDPVEMAKEKKVIFEEMGMVEDTPDDLVMEVFAEAFWPGHPLGRPIRTKRTVGRFRREDLASYFARVYRPANILIVAAGHLEHGSVLSLVSRPRLGQRRQRHPRRGRGRACSSPDAGHLRGGRPRRGEGAGVRAASPPGETRTIRRPVDAGGAPCPTTPPPRSPSSCPRAPRPSATRPTSAT